MEVSEDSEVMVLEDLSVIRYGRLTNGAPVDGPC